MTREEFIQKIAPMCVATMKSQKILASLSLAQGILESGNGGSELATKANALFGIKATSTWKGKKYTVNTKEWVSDATVNGQFVPGHYITIQADFRAYDNWDASIEDHGNFLVVNTRYAKVVGETNYKLACQYIKDAGYATDPSYPTKLISLIETYKLYEYDKLPVEIPVVQTPAPIEQPKTNNVTVSKVKFNVNGALFETEGFLVDGRNYAAVRQLLETLGLTVGWENDTVIVTSPPFVTRGAFCVNGEDKEISRILFEGSNYIKASELDVVGVEASWDGNRGIANLNTKSTPVG